MSVLPPFLPGSRRGALFLLTSLLAPFIACSVYDEGLLPDQSSGTATGGLTGTGGIVSTGGTAPNLGGMGNTDAGGTGGTGVVLPDVDLTIIADMEAGTNEISLIGGDYWFTTGQVATCISPNVTDDEMVASTDLPDPRPRAGEPDGGDSFRAMHFVGTDCVTWGSQAGFGLQAGSSYDANEFDGIAFWARLGSEQINRNLRVELADVNTHPDGELCGQEAGTENECFAHYYRIRQLNPDPGTWTFIQIPFSDFVQPSYGYQGGEMVDTTQLYQVLFKWPVPGSEDFDVWIDDIYFYTDR